MNAEKIIEKTDNLISELLNFDAEETCSFHLSQELLARCDAMVNQMTAAWTAGIREEMEAKKQKLFDARFKALGV